jgi:hypothetical protein
MAWNAAEIAEDETIELDVRQFWVKIALKCLLLL